MKISGKLYSCSICNKKKSLADYYLKKNGTRAFSKCKCCKRKLDAEYREGRREIIKEQHKEWTDRNQESERLRLRQHARANKEQYAERSRLWRKDNPHLHAAKEAKRRSAKLNRTPPWLSEADISRIKSIYKACNRITKKTGVLHHVDHIVPLQGKNVSGLHVPWNLQVIPAKQNLSKSNHFNDDMI